MPVEGWNTRIGGLDSFLKVDLGHYYKSNRAEFGDDPFRVMFLWLVWCVVDGMMKNDEIISTVHIESGIDQAVGILAGTTRRQGIG